MRELIYAILLGIVEGVTEFLPISSTGHLVLCERWMGLDLDDPGSMWKTFAVFIQIGAILAVVVYFRDRIMALLTGRETGAEGARVAGTRAQRMRVLVNIALGTVPVLVVGLLTHDWIEDNLSSMWIVAAALFFGGIVMLLVEWWKPAPRTDVIEDMSWKQALGIGLVQVLAAVFPGTSRSAATIVGGMVGGLSRAAAAEFSFFLAIPAMFAACGYSLLKFLLRNPNVTRREVLLFAVGTLVSFLVAWAVIDWFMRFIRRRTFVPFAIYRIVLAIVVVLVAR